MTVDALLGSARARGLCTVAAWAWKQTPSGFCESAVEGEKALAAAEKSSIGVLLIFGEIDLDLWA